MSKDKPLPPQRLDNSEIKIGVACARYNQDLTDALLDKTLRALYRAGVLKANVEVLRVPGAGELPYVATSYAELREVHAIICLGLIIAGDTSHHEVLANSTANALQQVTLEFSVPVINGIITVNTRAQAMERVSGDLNRGEEFAHAAIEMAHICSLFDQRVREMDEEETRYLEGQTGDWDEDDDADYWKKS